MPLRNNLFTNRNYKIRVLHAANHLAIIYAIYNFSVVGLSATIALYYFFFGWGIVIGMHRLFSHRSFETNYSFILAIFATLATVGSTIAWVGMHRKHHVTSDKVDDPHSPRSHPENSNGILAFLQAYIGIWPNYVATARHSRGVRRQRLHKFLHYYYFLIILLYICPEH